LGPFLRGLLYFLLEKRTARVKPLCFLAHREEKRGVLQRNCHFKYFVISVQISGVSFCFLSQVLQNTGATSLRTLLTVLAEKLLYHARTPAEAPGGGD
jgi:hypothetical protein